MLEDYFFIKNTKWVLWGAFVLVVMLLVFHAGVVVGQHQPMRGNMLFIKGGSGMPQQDGMLGGIMPRQGFVESGHGAVGAVATVTLPTFILQTRDGYTEKIYAATDTVVTGGASPSPSALMRGQTVIVVGDPNDTDDGFLDARIIHILPSPR